MSGIAESRGLSARKYSSSPAAQPTSSATTSFRRMGAAFASGGDRYERLRPGYPDVAVDWLVDQAPGAGAVADVGAGTGKLTAGLVARGFDVVAVDPSDDMLTQLRQRLPTVRVHVGTGESTGLAPGSADLVTFAQSWHWVEPGAGVAEIERILKPAGRAAWIWNFLDLRVAWVAELAEIWHAVAGQDATDATRHAPNLTSVFEPVETITIDWVDTMNSTELAALVTTRSYYLNASAVLQRRIRSRAAAFLTNRFPDAGRIDPPYRTHCYRTGLRRRTNKVARVDYTVRSQKPIPSDPWETIASPGTSTSRCPGLTRSNKPPRWATTCEPP
jgi:SAM-dependent methyltransferase